ncbi:hypothetical protein Z950_1242 [Sulfitobacter mediterraneus KCTC 32188]|nr:hypothetical protein Z950_1242 [Sulfitobacter mediterraneus KCTC 32188]
MANKSTFLAATAPASFGKKNSIPPLHRAGLFVLAAKQAASRAMIPV